MYRQLYSVKTKSTISTLKGPSVNRKDLQALNLVGPTWNNPVLDPLALLHPDNQLFICFHKII